MLTSRVITALDPYLGGCTLLIS